MIEQMTGFSDQVVAIRASREVTRTDYETVLVPAVEAALKTHDKIALYYETAPDFTGYSQGAMEEDAMIGFRHMFRFSRAAIVSDVGWIRISVGAFRPLFPCPVKLYRPAEEQAAKHWVESGED